MASLRAQSSASNADISRSRLRRQPKRRAGPTILLGGRAFPLSAEINALRRWSLVVSLGERYVGVHQLTVESSASVVGVCEV